MKKELSFIFPLFIIVSLILMEINLINAEELKGELPATGPQTQDLAIFVLPSPPIISIISPTNTTYSDTQILFNYTSHFEDLIWFKYNNTNITLTTPVILELSEGSHTIYLYANNSLGTVLQTISFTIDLTPIQPPADPDSPGGNSPSGTTQQPKPEIPIIIGPLILNTDEIQTSIGLGESQQESIILKNLGETTLTITLQNSDLQEFLTLSQTNFELLPGEEKIIFLTFKTSPNSAIQTYTGKIILKTTNIEKEILIKLIISEKEIEIPKIIKELSWKIILSILIILVLIGILISIKYKRKTKFKGKNKEKVQIKELQIPKKKKEKRDFSSFKKIIRLALPFNQSK